MVETMEHTYTFHHHTRSMSSLASTIVPIHSDTSTSTSVTASPMELLEDPGPPVELKIPLSDTRSALPSLEVIYRDTEGTPIPGIKRSMDPQIKSPSSDYIRSVARQSREEPYGADQRTLRMATSVEHPSSQGLDRAGAEGAEPTSTNPVIDLKDLIDSELYHRNQVASLQNALHGCTLADALNRRLIPCLSVAYQAMAECYQAGNQAVFADLYRCCEDMSEICKDLARKEEPESDLASQPPSNSWLETLPQNLQGDVVEFISRLRTDIHFLANRLSALSFSAFAKLLSFSPSLLTSRSSFAPLRQRKTGAYDKESFPQGNPPILENLHNFHQGNPLFVLFHTVFDSSSGPGTEEYFRRTQVWSAACARIITEGKPGSDELILTTLDAFASTRDWQLASPMECYIAKVLQDGAFLVDPNLSLPDTVKVPLEIRNANAAIATSTFFDKALKDLLALLLNTSPSNIMPEGLLHLVHSILHKISNVEVRTRARKFIIFKWFVSSFLGRILEYPESSNMMTKSYIGSGARNVILKEIASRLQKTTFDVQHSWKSTVAVLDPDMHSLIERVLERFECPVPDMDQAMPAPQAGAGPIARTLMLSARDVAGLLSCLYPACADSKNPASPSTAGSSTLITDPIHQDEILPSYAPSSSGTLDVNSVFQASNPLDPWENYTASTSKVNYPNRLTLLHQNKGLSDDLDDRLVRVYRCLSPLLQSGSNSTYAISTTDWASFTIDAEGKVLVPHHKRDVARNYHLANGEDYIVQNVQDSIHELQSCIVNLLSQKDRLATALQLSPLTAGSQVKGVNPILNTLINAAIDQATVNYDYQGLHYWWQMQKLLQDYEGPADSLLHSIANRCEQSIRAYSDESRGIEKQLYKWTSLRELQNGKLRLERDRRKALRTKMWYVSDVRHSSTFEDALHVTQALRAMANTTRSKHASGVANWARQRLRNLSWQDRSIAQTVEALTEPNEHGGICKLNGEQVERTSRWLTRQSIENFCRGEERIQRFCFEIQKCVNKFTGPTLLESPVLWSSRLFEQEKRSFDRRPPTVNGQVHSNVTRNASSPLTQNSHTDWIQTRQGEHFRSMDTPKSHTVPRDSSPKEPVRSLPLHLSQASIMPSGSEWLPNLSSIGFKHGTQSSKLDSAKAIFTTEIKRDLCSLMLSDLGCLLWHSGTETDVWVKQRSLDDDITWPIHRNLAPNAVEEKEGKQQAVISNKRDDLRLLLMASTGHLQDPNSKWHTRSPRDAMTLDDNRRVRSGQKSVTPFPYKQSYQDILGRFSQSQDPHDKLRMLDELEHLISYSIHDSMSRSSPRRSPSHIRAFASLSRSQSLLVPRTKATSFEEVIANCTERRAGTLRLNRPPSTPSFTPDSETFGTDEIVDTFLSIFRDPSLRPPTLFRDLQYIAAFVPADILDQTPQGKAFWDAGLAALALKEELCDALIARATDITNYHISASASSPDPAAAPLHTKSLVHTTLEDAAQLWIVAAKEGSATAARELGLLYLTHPEVLPRTTLQPFSKPKEVFRMVGARKEGSTLAEEGRLDPVTFAVVFHWMEIAANGGDKDARDFLKGNGEWGVGR